MNKSEFLELNLPSRDNTTDIADINAISDNFRTIDSVFLSLIEDVFPKFQTKENINLNFDDDSTNEEQYPSVPAVVNFTNRKVNPLKIVNSASGNAIAIKDSAKDKLVNLKLYGKTEQDGIPTPDNPIELKSIGDSGSFEVGVYGRNILKYPYNETTKTEGGITFTDNGDGIITANGTATRKVNFVFGSYGGIQLQKGKTYVLSGCASGGNRNTYCIMVQDSSYTQTAIDSGDGAPFTAEFNDYAIWIRIHEGVTLNNVVFKPQLELGTQATPFKPFNQQSITFTDTLRGIGDIADEIDFAKGVLIQRVCRIESYNGETITTDYISSTGELSTGAEVVYVLPTPIETSLTETELNAYRQLHTNKPNTTIISEADMEISYVADTKLYIDNKLAELTALTLEV
jgi:hypothetical protein